MTVTNEIVAWQIARANAFYFFFLPRESGMTYDITYYSYS